MTHSPLANTKRPASVRAMLDQFGCQLLAHPAQLVAVLCVAQIVLWTIVPAVTALAPPIDVIEGYLWGREWVLATYKHPALPSWILELSRVVTGRIGWPGYLVSQLFIAASLVLIYLLGRELMDEKRGAAAVLAMTGVLFFSWSSAEFNHNIAQMPFWIGLIWALWHATRLNGALQWLLVALFAVACVYTKLSCAVLLLTGGLWVLWDDTARRSLRTPYPWLALVVFLALTSPLMAWLWAHNFQPLDYAERRATSASSVGIPEFLMGQVGRHVGLFGMLAYAGLLWDARRPASENQALPMPAPPTTGSPMIAPDARAFLLIMAVGPLLALLVASIVMGMQLKTAWTASMSTVSGLIAIALSSRRFDSYTFARLARAAVFVLLLTVALFSYESMVGFRDTGRYRPQQAAWPADEIARTALDVWAKTTPAPLHIVVGETRIAGLVALAAKTLPSLMTEAEEWRAPWVTPERLRKEGMLLVWAEPGGLDSQRIRAMVGEAPIRNFHIPWPRTPAKPPLNLFVAAVPPQPDAGAAKP